MTKSVLFSHKFSIFTKYKTGLIYLQSSIISIMKPNPYNLKKLESLFEAFEYSVRYAQGNFQSGYCLVKDQKVVVINKFFDLHGRLNTLIEILFKEILPNHNIDSIEQQKYIKELKSWYDSNSVIGK